MDDLCRITTELKELLSDLLEYKDKEELIFKHIKASEKLNWIIEDFPSNLDWFNTLEPLCNNYLKGKIVVLDFFTYCCINCLHVIPHLRELEKNFSVPDGLVVIGVHSAKFDNEKESKNILMALKKYNISHPVVNDKNCYMWNKLNISCWPTIVILGPQKQALFVLVGESHKDELFLFVKVALKFYKSSIRSHQLPIVLNDEIVTSSLLSFPGKISRWRNLFAVSDSGNHRIIIFDENGYIKFKIGGKTPGLKDGSFDSTLFNSPQGIAFHDFSEIYVADTENHAIRLINLESLRVTTVVGNGQQGVDYEGGRTGTLQEISSPWDVCVVPSSDVEVVVTGRFVHPSALSGSDTVSFPPPYPLCSSNPSLTPLPPPPPPPPPPHVFTSSRFPSPSTLQSALYSPRAPLSGFLQKNSVKNLSSSKVLLIAAAGTHQIWAYFISGAVWWKGKKYEKNVCAAIAGNGKEENRNNRYPMMASFAQPSSLAYSQELKSVFIADSESSSVRRLSLKDGSVSHVVGGGKSPTDLFSYGDLDGKAHDAKLQHPLGLIWSSKENSLFVCDTYNHKIKRIDVSSSYCKSLHENQDLFNEPNGGCFSESEDVLYICDTNNNCIKVINLTDGSVNKLEIQEKTQGVARTTSNDVWEAETSLSKTGGTLTLKIEFIPKEVHGKWSLKLDESKIKTDNLKGKLTNNVLEFTFNVGPSTGDDFLQIFFDLILCGNEICSFKKLALRFHVRRKEIAQEFSFCELKKNLV